MIKESAVKKNGFIYTGKRHCDILNGVEPFGFLKDGEQGFITDTGKFLNRKEAGLHAINCGQVKRLLGGILYSEDLY